MSDLEISTGLVSDIRSIWTNAQVQASRSVNSELVKGNWLIGRRIVEEEQGGRSRAEYGDRLLSSLSSLLQKELGEGFSLSSLKFIRLFYGNYPDLIPIRSALRNESYQDPQEWHPGRLHPSLSWTHYKTLMRVSERSARDFYEIEVVKNGCSARALEGQVISRPVDAIKDPYVLEFLDLPESPRWTESDLETALISKLQEFLRELGTGFAFVGRQKRITLEGDHFYPDLVFYHTKLKCFVIIDLKIDKLSHADLGQMQLYVNFYDQEVAEDSDSPTVGLILCTDKNDTMVKYVLGDDHQQIFASRYQFQMPTVEQLQSELLREIEQLGSVEKPQ